jgi:hypothetical protein
VLTPEGKIQPKAPTENLIYVLRIQKEGFGQNPSHTPTRVHKKKKPRDLKKCASNFQRDKDLTNKTKTIKFKTKQTNKH